MCGGFPKHTVPESNLQNETHQGLQLHRQEVLYRLLRCTGKYTMSDGSVEDDDDACGGPVVAVGDEGCCGCCKDETSTVLL